VSTLAEDRASLRRLADGKTEGDVGPLIRRGTRVLLLILWVLSLLVAAFSGWLLIKHAEEHTRSTAVSLEQFAQRTITLAAFVVDEYEEALDLRGNLAGIAEDAVATQRLRELTRWLPAGSVGGLVLPDGLLTVSTIPTPSPPPKLNDRRWFAAVTQDGQSPYVGPALQGRVNKNFFFTYSSAYRGADGKLLGVINLGIPSDSITGLAPDQHNTNMALVQHEGPVVAALPFKPALVGQMLPLPVTPSEGEATVFGTVFDAFSIATLRNIPSLSLYSVVALPLSGVLEPLFWGLAIGFPLLLLISLLLLALSNQLQAKSQQVEQALADNKVLFQEVHHRVKNNLQVVSSLLRLQTERLPPELRPLLDETGARVRAIALVHEQIYRTASPSDVQLDRFLAQLVQQLSASMIGGTGKITTELQPVTIGLDSAVPVAILATEAITNAIKHGLDNGEGTITVSLASKDGRNVIAVRDSGGTLRDEGQPGLGTRIMTALARQIDGEWSLAPAPEGGMVYSLSWPA
jgi:two-component sensor histidine kinase